MLLYLKLFYAMDSIFCFGIYFSLFLISNFAHNIYQCTLKCQLAYATWNLTNHFVMCDLKSTWLIYTTFLSPPHLHSSILHIFVTFVQTSCIQNFIILQWVLHSLSTSRLQLISSDIFWKCTTKQHNLQLISEHILWYAIRKVIKWAEC
jgi:hypothetical protein